MTSTPDDGPRQFFHWVEGLVHAGDPRLTSLGAAGGAIRAGVDDLARSVRRSLWHMTALPSWGEVGAARPLAEVADSPRVEYRYVTTPRATGRLPMLTSHHRGVRLAPVVAPLLIVDASLVFVGVPRGNPLTGGVWSSTIPHVVAAAVRCFEHVWQGSEPAVPPGEDPPFTRRMVDIAFLLTDGASDRQIARQLHVSERTVSADVSEVIRRLGARNRSHAIALIGSGTY
ncbi:helix-turn-helix transcriptional regulator [Phycicoccus sp. CSK15P-2]|uniref:helix-turn-helix transcriptional regulator n=1 Tax=Phycicoccus sp. CSK15P-2 TaxID=2807627 RepID=UPI001951CA65|nr:helix-turn-helix transcriptional regulator [Phycicoccus sp. CSK15P-2]MBM6403588.1 helix-turn-helix transcriptional regulator [Phycicoccus sp. CSK15P-2]MBM6405053.1 helix-turn-helix transcriptional regulator [Phycicoccus sp. CSK15P-2]